ncbi:PBP1A family penicillin-binding protein [soil metagenome]
MRRIPISKRVVVRVALVIGALVLVLAIAATLIVAHFAKLAGTFDLAEVTQIEGGATVMARDGSSLGPLAPPARQLVSLGDLPDHLVDALVATEDRRFYAHGGYDLGGVLRAALTNLRAARIRQGASTITQQLARQTYSLPQGALARKLTEIILARRIEGAYSKEEILDAYLNRVYFGSGFYGVGAAAHGYFGKPANALTVPESATLVGLLKRPSAYSPLRNPALAREGRDHVLNRMAAAGSLPPGVAADLAAEPLAHSAGPRPSHDPTFGYPVQDAARRLADLGIPTHGAIAVQTTIDPALQTATAAAIARTLDPFGPDLQGAAIVVDSDTGEILACAGGREFSTSPFDRTFQALRPAGTAILPFVYAAALEAGLPPDTPVADAPLDNRLIMVGATTGILGEWGLTDPSDTTYSGTITAHAAIARGKNSAAARLGTRAGLDRFLALARRAGLEDSRAPLRDAPSSFLGQTETTLANLALAYTLIPGAGSRPGTLTLVKSVPGRYAAPAPAGSQVVSDLVAAQIHSTLATDSSNLTGQRIGASYGRADLWAVAYSREVTCAVWIGFDQPRPIPAGVEAGSVLDAVFVAVCERHPPRVPIGAAPAPEAPAASPEERDRPSESAPLGIPPVRPDAPSLTGPDPYGTLSP